MKVVVLMKRVPDTASAFKISADNKSIVTDGVKYVMSPYDEYAVEEAIKLKETKGAEVVVLSLGPPESKETIRTALAMGADSAVLITGDGIDRLGSKGVALCLAAVVKTLSPDVIFAGKQAVDDDASQVGERIAEVLDMPHASVITRFELGNGAATVDREIEGGHYTLEVPLPAVFTVQKGINTPRYPTLPNIMKAKKKEIKELVLSELNLRLQELSSGVIVEAMELPRQERLGKMLSGDAGAQVRELVRILREDEKVL